MKFRKYILVFLLINVVLICFFHYNYAQGTYWESYRRKNHRFNPIYYQEENFHLSNTLFIANTNDREYLDEKANIFKGLSIEIICGGYLTFKDTIHYGSRIISPSFMSAIGGKVSYEFVSNVALAISGNYSNAKNLEGFYYCYFDPPSFSIFSFSFVCSYKKGFAKRYKYYFGGGFSLIKAKLFLNGKILSTEYFCPLVSADLKLEINSFLYIGLQNELYLLTAKWGSSKVHIRQILPKFDINFGYKFF